VNTGRLAGLAAVAAVLAVSACTPANDGEPPVVKAFGAQGWGVLKPGMTKQDALATGELDPDPIAVLSGCSYYTMTGGARPDPAWSAADEAADQAHRNAAIRAKELIAGVGPSPAPEASPDDQVAWLTRTADAARAVSGVAELAAGLSDRADDIVGPANPTGVVSFFDGRVRVIGAPLSARTVDGIGDGSTVDDLRKTYLGRGLGLTSPGRYEMPARGRAGWVMDFDYVGSEVVYVQLRDTNAKCA
jgi:hypothetical protein